MNTIALVSAFTSSVAGHAALIGIGPDRCKQSPRQPSDEPLVQQTSGTDGGMTNLQGVRCVAHSSHQATTEKKIQGWCADTGDWTNKSRDQGFCFGTTKGTYTSD